jgi:hypothetical protein
MIDHKRIVALAMTASLALSISGLSAQDPEPTKRRRPPEEVTKEEHYKAQQKARRAHGVDAHVKKMLALAMELREGGFEEEAQVLIRQAKRLAHKGRRRPRSVETIREGEPRAVARVRRPVRVPVRVPRPPRAPDVIDVEEVKEIEEVESPRARVNLDVIRTRERSRARAEYEKARRMKEDMVRRDRARAKVAQREQDLDRRVEHLSRQVRELREMIQELKRVMHQRQKGDNGARNIRRGPRAR